MLATTIGSILGMASVLGTGSIIRGSIRYPAAFCEVWGIRTSQKSIFMLGKVAAHSVQNQEAVLPVMRPLARNADDIDLFKKSLMDRQP